MQTAGARPLREDDNEMSREAVLLQWEQKIEAAERRERTGPEAAEERPGGRFARPEPESERPEPESERPTRGRPTLALVETPAEPEPARDERPLEPSASAAERRTITITGRPTPPRRRHSVVETQLAQPDRIALWAFLLGLFLVAVAAGTAHA